MAHPNPLVVQLSALVFPARRLRLLAVLLGSSLVFALFYLGSQPISGGLFTHPFDKFVHYLFFGGLTGVFWVIFGGKPVSADLLAFGLTAAVGVADEWAQAFNPGRSASAADFMFDALGALTAVLVLARLRGWLERDAANQVIAARHPQTS